VSKGNRNQLRGRYRDGIIRKALRGHPLGLAENRFSDLISKHRFRIKQCPGTMKRVFGLYRACYFDFIITHVQLPIAATGQYLLKAAKKSHPPHKKSATAQPKRQNQYKRRNRSEAKWITKENNQTKIMPPCRGLFNSLSNN